MQKIYLIHYKRSHLLAISLGIAVVSCLPALPSIALLVLVSFILLLVNRYYGVGTLGLCFLMGVGWSTLYGEYGLYARLPYTHEVLDLQVTGFVQDLPQSTEQGQRFVFNVETIHNNPSLHLRKLSLSTYNTDIIFHAAQRWVLNVRLKPPHGFKNKGGFDYEAWLFEQGIDASGYVKEAKPIGTTLNLWAQINAYREWLRDRIGQLIPASDYKGIITALTIGDGYLISSDQWRVFNRTSTSHLIAISGLHISMIAAFCFSAITIIGKRLPIHHLLFYIPIQKIAACIALIVTIFYSLLTGMSIPTQRTLVMVAVSMLALIMNQHIKPSYLFCIALLAVLLWDPLAVTAAGFWLSFIAVGGLLFGLLGRVDTTAFQQWVRAQWIIFVGLIPVMGICLHQLSLIGPLANVMAIPVISFLVTPLCLVGALMSIFYETAAKQILLTSDFLLTYLWEWLSLLSHYDHASITLADRGVVQWLLCSIGVIMLILPRGLVGRYWGLLALSLLVLPTNIIHKNTANIMVADVGQGLAVIVQTAQHTLIYDVGPRFSDKLDAGSAVIVPYLRYVGVSVIDKVIVSHADNDHSGGLLSVLENIPAQEIITGSIEKIDANHACQHPEHWQWDGVTFDMLWPLKELQQDKENNRSCVLKISMGTHSVLLTGDIEKPVEQTLVSKYGNQLHSDLLIAPHHGSKTSSTDLFISAVNPSEVVFSSGYMNRFGHPHPSVVDRYEHYGVKWLNTADSGGILYLLDGEGITLVEQYRKAHRHYWDAF